MAESDVSGFRKAMIDEALVRLNRVVIEPKDMEAVLIQIRNLQTEQDSFAAVLVVIREMFPEKSGDFGLALALRLHALAVVLEDLVSIPGLVRTGVGGAAMVARCAIAAACDCDLAQRGEQPAAFDPVEFRAAAMNVITPTGTA
jgi:hypothetical protein